MKRTLQTLLFALIAIMMPIGTMAQEADAVAKIGDTEYTNFADALANWTDGTTLTLLTDIPDGTRTTAIEISDKTVTLDLNGYTLDMSSVEYAIAVRSGALNIYDSGEDGALKGQDYAVFTSGGVLNVFDGCLTGSRVSVYLNGGESNISGGTLTGKNGIWNVYAIVNISGSPTINGTSAALRNYRDMTISGEPVLNGGDYGDICMGEPVILNTQPADGTWLVFMGASDITKNKGVFAIPGEGVTLDVSKFTSVMDGYEVKQNAKGGLLLCNHQVAYEAISNEDGCTHKMVCYCGEYVVEESVACSGGMANCHEQAVCRHCGQSYGETDPYVHTFDNDGKCVCGAERGEATTVDLSTLTGTYVINDSEEYIFTGTGNYGIKVESGNPRIVLSNVNIAVSSGSAIDIPSGSTTTIQVIGDNTISTTKTESYDEPCGGIFVAEGGTVNITSNGTNNVLRAHGTLAAAIGGKYVYGGESHNAGNINISNVTVYAYTNNYYAAAIGAAGNGTCGTINITNAVVYAYGAGDQYGSAPGIGSAWGVVGWPDTIPVVFISDSEVHTYRYNSGSDYIGYFGDVEIPMNATGSINCGGGSVKNSTIYCYTGLDATTTDETVKYGALGGLLVEDENGDWVCEGEHAFANGICENCGYKCTHEGGTVENCHDNGDGTHSFTCSICGDVTEDHVLATYSADDNTNTITVACDKGCSGTVTISAEGKTYDGEAVKVVVLKTGVMEDADIALVYSKDGETFAGELVDAGAYTVSLTIGGETVSVDFAIAQAAPTVTEPAGLTAVYGQTLADVILPAQEDGTAGKWSWKESTTTSVGNVGARIFTAIFTPDNDNYATIEANVTVEVAKAEITINSATIENVYYNEEGEYALNVSDVTFDGLVGDDVMTLGTDYTAMAILVGANRIGAVDATVTVVLADDSNYNLEITTFETTVNIEEDTTGIENPKMETGNTGVIYDLQGRRVEHPKKGIYIVDGKKVWIK